MIDSNLRSPFQNFFDSAGLIAIKAGISPNVITLNAFLIGIACMAAIITRQFYLAIALLWLSGFLDVLDGTVARLQKRTSYAGMYMDLTLDRMVEAAVIFGFAVAIPEFNLSYMAFLIFALFNFTTFLVAGSVLPNKGTKGIHYDTGIIERTEAFIAFTLMMIFRENIFYILFVFNSLMLLTGLLRFFRVMDYISKNVDNGDKQPVYL